MSAEGKVMSSRAITGKPMREFYEIIEVFTVMGSSRLGIKR
jgi:hypothetical protein